MSYLHGKGESCGEGRACDRSRFGLGECYSLYSASLVESGVSLLGQLRRGSARGGSFRRVQAVRDGEGVGKACVGHVRSRSFHRCVLVRSCFNLLVVKVYAGKGSANQSGTQNVGLVVYDVESQIIVWLLKPKSPQYLVLARICTAHSYPFPILPKNPRSAEINSINKT